MLQWIKNAKGDDQGWARCVVSHKKPQLFTTVCHMCFHFPHMAWMEKLERACYKIGSKLQILVDFSSPLSSTYHLSPYYLMIVISCHMPRCVIRVSLHGAQALPSNFSESLPFTSWQTFIRLLKCNSIFAVLGSLLWVSRMELAILAFVPPLLLLICLHYGISTQKSIFWLTCLSPLLVCKLRARTHTHF